MITELSPRTLYPTEISPKNCPNMLLCRFMFSSHKFQFSISVANLVFGNIGIDSLTQEVKTRGLFLVFFLEGHNLYIGAAKDSGFKVVATGYTRIQTLEVSSPSLMHKIKDILPIENKELYLIDDAPIEILGCTVFKLTKYNPRKPQ